MEKELKKKFLEIPYRVSLNYIFPGILYKIHYDNTLRIDIHFGYFKKDKCRAIFEIITFWEADTDIVYKREMGVGILWSINWLWKFSMLRGFDENNVRWIEIEKPPSNCGDILLDKIKIIYLNNLDIKFPYYMFQGLKKLYITKVNDKELLKEVPKSLKIFIQGNLYSFKTTIGKDEKKIK